MSRGVWVLAWSVALASTIATGCYASHERPAPDDASDDWRSADAGIDAPLLRAPDASFDAAARPPPEGCSELPDATSPLPDRESDAGPRTGSPVRGVSAASDGAGYGVVWEDWSDRTIRFVRLSLDGAVVSRSMLAHGGGGRLLPAIAWNGERFGVAYQSSPAEMSFVEVDRDGTPLGSPAVAATDACAFRAPLVWSGDRWTRVTVTESEPHRAVVTQVVPGVGLSSAVLADVVANACDTMGAAWNGDGFGVVWSDWTSSTSRMMFVRLDGSGRPIDGSRRVLRESPILRVEGHEIVWTGTDYIAGGASSPFAHVSVDGELGAGVPGDDVNQDLRATLRWTGCEALSGFVIQPSFSFGYLRMRDEGVYRVTLAYGNVDDIDVVAGAGEESAFFMSHVTGVFFRRIGLLGPLGDWRSISGP